MVRQRPDGSPSSLPSSLSRPGVLRLLLLAALLLGVVTMHTLGHPSGSHGGTGGHGDRPGHGARMTAAQQLPEHHAAVPAADAPVTDAAVTDAPVTDAAVTDAPMTDAAMTDAAVTADPAAGGGMDPMAVCLAVLAGWTLLLLVVGPLLRRSGDAAAGVRARLLRAVRALPPPGGGRILLSRLSVLRQ
ncbi:hypothetical protein [Kitasatospora sp. NPDC089509]|uniref:hypothetical protein n=1 Tax=Kitasatospora sp. NPDC089509 TaxID=3364079 RepID=UPI0038077B20